MLLRPLQEFSAARSVFSAVSLVLEEQLNIGVILKYYFFEYIAELRSAFLVPRVNAYLPSSCLLPRCIKLLICRDNFLSGLTH